MWLIALPMANGFLYLFFRFLSPARQLAKALEVPLVNDLGYTKRYVRCLQVVPTGSMIYGEIFVIHFK